MKDIVWTGGRVTPPNIVGAETYMYYNQGWNVTINYPVVPNAIYNIVADYSTRSIGIPYRVIWKGLCGRFCHFNLIEAIKDYF